MVRQARKEDAFELARLAIQMWKDSEIEELMVHVERLAAPSGCNKQTTSLIAVDQRGI